MENLSYVLSVVMIFHGKIKKAINNITTTIFHKEDNSMISTQETAYDDLIIDVGKITYNLECIDKLASQIKYHFRKLGNYSSDLKMIPKTSHIILNE